MPLAKQIVSIPLGNGVDTKDATALVPNNKFLQLQNATFVKGAGGELQKRNGYTRLTQLDNQGNTLSNGQMLTTYGSELVEIANGNLYSLAPTETAWVKRATVTNIVPGETQIVDNSYVQSNPDSATVGGVTLYAWEDTRGGVWIKAVDENTGATLFADTQFSATGGNPRVIVNGNSLVVLVSTTAGGIYKGTVTPGTVVTVPVPVAVLLGISASTPFEIVLLAANWGIVYLDSSGYAHATTLALGTLTQVNSVALRSTVMTAITANVAGNGSLVVGSGSVAAGGYYVDFLNPSTLGSRESQYLLNSYGEQIMILPSLVTATTVYLLVQQAPAAADRYINRLGVDQTTGYISTSVLLRGVGLVSVPLVYNGVQYLLVNFPSTTQQTFFLVNAVSGAVVGRFYSYNAGPFPTKQRLSHWQTLSTGVFGLALTNATVLLTSTGTALPTTLFGLARLQLDFTQVFIQSTQLGQDLTIAGALPQVYDGVNLVEAGFNVYPDPVTITLLTSQIGLVAIIDGAPAVAQTFRLTFPVNPKGNGFDGQLITPGEYLVINGYIYYWVVDGAGFPSGTSGTSYTQVSIPINSTDSASTIATKTGTAIGLSGQTVYTLPVTGQNVNFTATAVGYLPRPGLGRQLESAVTVSSGSTHAQFSFNCIPGQLIHPGQYLTWQAYPGAVANRYLYFTVGGVGTDPAPFGGNGTGVACNILSTDIEYQVATKVAAAINAATSSLNSTAAASGPIVTVANTANGAVTLPATTWTVGLNALGSTSTAGTDSYQASAVYEWVDAKGQLHRSAPSIPTTILVAAYGLQNAQFSYTVKTLRLSARTGVDIAIYRDSAANGSNMQRVTSPTTLLYNNPAVDFVTYQDSTSDAALASGEFLYTTGNVAQNDPPPPMAQVWSHQDRLWGVHVEDPQLIWWSKFYATGVAVEWSALQTTRIDQSAGPVTQLATLDQNLIVFCQNQIWIISGTGPAASGVGTPFSPPAVISSSIGIRDPNCVVLYGDGLIFKSTKGYYLLTRSLQLSYIGEAVDAFNGDVIVSTQVVPGTTQIRFISQTGTTLFFDYFYGYWGSATNHQGIDSTLWNGAYTYLRTNGAVYQETPGYYFDDQTGFPLLVQTAWIKFADPSSPVSVQGFRRLWKAIFKGMFPGNNMVQFQYAVNYNPTVIDTRIFDIVGSGAAGVWGTDPVWGTLTPWGGSVGPTAPTLQIRYDVPLQLVEAAQFTIQDVAPFSSTAAYSLDAIDLEVGVKRGGFKLPIADGIG